MPGAKRVLLTGWFLLFCGVLAGADGTATFYVAPDGSDAASGSIEAPFATLETARDAVRALKREGRLPPGGVTVELRAGVYERRGPFALSREDSGRRGAPVVYRAYPGEEVRLSGGRAVRGFGPVSDAAARARLDPNAAEHVLVADLRRQGLRELGELTVRGFGQPVRSAHSELFFRDRPMTLARWPNEGYATIAGLPDGSKARRFSYSGDRPRRWREEADVWVYGYWYHDWADTYLEVESIDVEHRIITTATRHGYGLRKGNRWMALNVLAELDSPGEYYIDRERGVLYFWPPAPLEEGRAVVSRADGLVTLTDAEYVIVRGLVVEACRGTAVTVNGGRHNQIVGCTIRNTGNRGVAVTGSENAVIGCDLYETGDGGIALSGGERRTLTPARLLAENNLIDRYSRWCHTYRPAVRVGGCGNIVRHNLIHHGPHNAIQLGGNDHLIELNEIHHVCQDTGDVGAFYMGRDWTARGTVIRHNYWHHISGPGRLGAMGVYLDDQASGMSIVGNVFYDVTRAVFIGGGCDNRVENNIFVDCRPAVHIDARGLGWQKPATDDPEGTLRTRLRAMPYRNALWKSRYPELADILSDDPGTPKRNAVRRNVCAGGEWDDIHAPTRKFQVIEDNIVGKDPEFVDREGLDLRLRPSSPAFALGFEPIPVERIGLYRDGRRASRPPPETISGPGRVRVLFDFEPPFDEKAVGARDAEVSPVVIGGKRVLQIRTGTTERWPGITLRVPGGSWDLSGYGSLSVDLASPAGEVTVFCRVDNPGADGTRNCVTGSLELRAGESGTLRVPLPRQVVGAEEIEFIGMRGNPPVSTRLDPSNVTQLLLFVSRPREAHAFTVRGIRVTGRSGPARKPISRESFFPMIDEFGQYAHDDWPGKTRSGADLAARARAEERELDAGPGPPARNRYGGWTGGPRLDATGFFRVERCGGKWWLVDPEGRLFWSHGIDCVRSSNPTPITDREHYYRRLPEEGAVAAFYGSGRWAPHGYYKDHRPYRTYDFTRANLLRKYGEEWRDAFARVTHRRLRSWGLNTIANWSDPAVFRLRRTPYVATVHARSRELEGSEGYWGKFPDVFDPSFRSALEERVSAEKGHAVGDPWCIGFFVGNELSWGDEVSLAVAALASPSDQPAKKAFLADLEKKYRSIEKLNAAWGTGHASWKALLECEAPPDVERAREDLVAFYTRTAETYFRTVRDVLESHAPDQLYLGCRFAWVNDRAARAAAKYCDVISYNRYTQSVADFRLPGRLDRPVVIGEFHFGALDRGMFHTGLRKADDQEHRARLYTDYVRGALGNPLIVGTHWFQYKDQPTTGRGDGENYQIGFVDICDTPYPEIVRACREVARDLYEYRLRGR